MDIRHKAEGAVGNFAQQGGPVEILRDILWCAGRFLAGDPEGLCIEDATFALLYLCSYIAANFLLMCV